MNVRREFVFKMIKLKKGSTLIWIVIILILIGIGIYFFLTGDSSPVTSGSSIPQPPALPS
jgi:flagellar basal body-associated protein FliL